jgi:phage FluMu gp28-like protein
VSKARPSHAASFKGKAKNIPEQDLFMLSYQDRWIKDPAIMKLMEKSRRVGISYGSSYEDVRYHAQAESRLQTWVSSRDELTARQYVRDCMGFGKVLHLAAMQCGETVLYDDKGNQHTAQTIPFPNGTVLNSLSSNPDAFAGRGGRVKLDEFALRKDPGMVYAIAGPTIDWGGSLAIISTHRGSKNYFNTLIREIKEKNNPKRFSYHRVTLQDALDQCFLWKLQTKLKEGDPRLDMDEADYFTYQRSRARDEETFQQEYMCVPADDASAFIEYALIDSCCYKEGESWEWTLEEARKKVAAGARLYAGLDIGRHHDLTSLAVFERVGGVFLLRFRLDLEKMMFSHQEAIVYPWFEICARSCIDKTGLGMQFAERAVQRFGSKVEGVSFSGATKEDMAYPVRSAFEDGAIRIPFGDDKLISDIRKIRKETTAAGNVRFVADSDDDGHADRFWAVALALHAGKQAHSEVRMHLIEEEVWG